MSYISVFYRKLKTKVWNKTFLIEHAVETLGLQSHDKSAELQRPYQIRFEEAGSLIRKLFCDTKYKCF